MDKWVVGCLDHWFQVYDQKSKLEENRLMPAPQTVQRISFTLTSTRFGKGTATMSRTPLSLSVAFASEPAHVGLETRAASQPFATTPESEEEQRSSVIWIDRVKERCGSGPTIQSLSSTEPVTSLFLWTIG